MSDTEDDEEDDEHDDNEEDDEYVEEELDRFEAFCAALRRNDPDTTEITLSDCPRHIPQYGRRLGEALQGNQHVSYMSLRLSIDEEEGTDNVALLVRYIRESEAMRKVRVVSRHARDDRGYAPLFRRILLATAENPCITDLNLSINMEAAEESYAESFALLMQTTQSLKTLCFTLDGGVASSQKRDIIAEAFGANQTLENLSFQYCSETDMGEYILLRLGAHPRLRELKMEYHGNDSSVAEIHALASFLGFTTSLEHLGIGYYEFDKECMGHLVEGLHSNQSLTKLSVYSCIFNLEAFDVFRNFIQLDGTRSSIRELRIDEGDDYMSEGQLNGAMLASLLTMPDENHGTASSIASSLQILDLGYYFADFAGFWPAFEGDASRIRLTCLRLGRCFIETQAACDALIRCLPKLVYLKELDFHILGFMLEALCVSLMHCGITGACSMWQ